MNKRKIEELSAGTPADSNSKADKKHVSPAIANANVVGSLFSQREIKFRAWDSYSKKMIYPALNLNLFYSRFGKYYIDGFGNLRDSVSDKIPTEMLLNQYTGLKDKNNKEIYEGDIVNSFKKPYEDALSTNKVEFKNGCWSLACKGKNDIPLFLYGSKHLEVLGNIFENPELLQTLR